MDIEIAAAEELINDLDAIAREFNHFEYGLPTYSPNIQKQMVELVRDWASRLTIAGDLRPKNN